MQWERLDNWTIWIMIVGACMLFTVLVVMYLAAAFKKQRKIDEKRDLVMPCDEEIGGCGHDRIFHMWPDGRGELYTADCEQCDCDVFMLPAPLWTEWVRGKHRG